MILLVKVVWSANGDFQKVNLLSDTDGIERL